MAIKRMKYCDAYNSIQEEFWMDTKEEKSNLPTVDVATFSLAIAAKSGDVYYFNGLSWEDFGGGEE